MSYTIKANQFGYDIFVQAGGEITDNRSDAFVTDSREVAEAQAVMFTERAGYPFEAVAE